MDQAHPEAALERALGRDGEESQSRNRRTQAGMTGALAAGRSAAAGGWVMRSTTVHGAALIGRRDGSREGIGCAGVERSCSRSPTGAVAMLMHPSQPQDKGEHQSQAESH
ncbi:MAG TPA: hypothetical protein VNN09_13740 [Candidatus Competibacteraceae bacterium]|nr:hypothetical protein [Candidatus Competibacteraceae bacterium]